jgi:hypothetical protein
MYKGRGSGSPQQLPHHVDAFKKKVAQFFMVSIAFEYQQNYATFVGASIIILQADSCSLGLPVPCS